MDIKTINIIGSGNVATYLVRTLHSSIKIQTIYSRNLTHANILCKGTSAIPVDDLADLKYPADLTIICLNDDILPELAAKLPKHIPTVHTSGAVSASIFDQFQDFGILYPLQSISKERVASLHEIPFLIEANSPDFERVLLDFANLHFSKRSFIVDSATRLKVHLAAVLANNFSNYFLIRSKEILDEAGVDFDVLYPLMTETVEKAFLLNPTQAQTGPAKRGDKETQKKHLTLIKDEQIKRLYQLISELIQQEFSREK